jgi:RNA polymerase sigma factor (sigma-70 family)
MSIAATDPATWVDRHGDAMFSFAMTRLRDRMVAEDVVQEAFLAALEARDRFTGASTERTWLIGILKNKVVDRIRKAARDETMPALFERGYWRSTPRNWPRGAAEVSEFR